MHVSILGNSRHEIFQENWFGINIRISIPLYKKFDSRKKVPSGTEAADGLIFLSLRERDHRLGAGLGATRKKDRFWKGSISFGRLCLGFPSGNTNSDKDAEYQKQR